MPYPEACANARLRSFPTQAIVPNPEAHLTGWPKWARRVVMTLIALLPMSFPVLWMAVVHPWIKTSPSKQMNATLAVPVADDSAGSSLVPSTPTTITGAFIFIALAMSASQTYIIKRQFDGMDRRDERYANVANSLGLHARSIEELKTVIDELKDDMRELRRGAKT